jgi:nicotinamidase-related amidase
MENLRINTKTTALLVMDCQIEIINSLTPSEKAKVLGNLTRAISAARRASVSIIYVVVQFREGCPEISARNTLFSGMKGTGRLVEMGPDTRICNEIRPNPGEVIVIKRRISAFTGSDLEVVLRSKNIDTLVLTGVSSLGVVESTARQAFDMDYRIVVIEDCCSDRDPKANEIAISWLLPRTSTLCSIDDFVKAIS